MLVPFCVGVALGIFGVAKLIEWLLSRFPTQTYCAVLGLVVASPVAILLRTDMTGVSWLMILISLVTFALGFAAAMALAAAAPVRRNPGPDNPIDTAVSCAGTRPVAGDGFCQQMKVPARRVARPLERAAIFGYTDNIRLRWQAVSSFLTFDVQKGACTIWRRTWKSRAKQAGTY